MRRIDRYSRIIYDFNGTLLDDVWVGMAAVNPMLQRRGLPPIPSVEAYYELFGFPIEDYYRRLGFDFDKEPYADLAVEWVNSYRAIEGQAGLRRGARELLELGRSHQKQQFVFSATQADMLQEQLQQLDILDYFADVFGRSDIYAESKLELADRFTEQHGSLPSLYIGDTDHDAACAAALSAHCLLVGGGHQPESKLHQTGAPVFPHLTAVIHYLTENVHE